ncbi:Haemolytic domain-containing protein [Litoreibacter ascidiaceicola]|uniref:Haemolytic domain-containing protein n=1 Tax=Litoreibacter ascidiaceicola TaxID=1486859 RepID=A0A1M4ZNS4_9RHOB|nr:membrane protein insertion efficiency factor YidD [Litoreibacter ascidiaceicola]SHF19760.1 Haemolytic domain-containing protein [Litoreibacter ascidiaceicola]
MFSKMALGGIWAYQQYLSPSKGFRCAYSVRHGGTGCSGYAKHAIRDLGLWRALPAIRERFRDCRTAHLAIKAACVCNQAPLDEDERAELERRRRDDKWYNKYDCCSAGACECGSAPFGCFGRAGASKAAASKGCDVNPCDGDIGFGGCDCASCDCGGCSCG